MIRTDNWLAKVSIESYVLPILILMLVFSTNNRLILVMKPLSYLISFAVVFFAMASRRKLSQPSAVKYLFMGFVALAAFSVFYTPDRASLLDYLPYLIAGASLVLFQFDDDLFTCIFKLFSIVFWVFIASMYLELLAPSLFQRLFSFLSLGKNLVVRSVDGVAVSGLAFEKAYAAFLCNLGLGVLLARLFTKGINISTCIEILIVSAALMMTGKRALFIIPLVGIIGFTLLFTRNHRVMAALSVTLVVIILVLVAYAFIPQVSLVFDRLFADNGDPLSGREVFWGYAIQMFLSAPVFGVGFLSFNSYAFERGFLYYGEPWRFQAHNVYLQVLAELGIVGFTILSCLFAILIIGLVREVKYRPSLYTLTALYWIVLIALYSLTGNTIYYACQFIVLSIVCMVFLKYVHGGGKHDETFGKHSYAGL